MMTDTTPEQPVQKTVVRPIGKVKKAPSLLQNPIVQEIIGGFLVPLVKGSILSIVERLLYGEQGSPGTGTGLGSGQVGYQKHFGQNMNLPVTMSQQNRFQKYQQIRSQFPQLEDLVFQNEQTAILVINALYDRIEQYSYASVADLYEIVGLKAPDFTYVQFGWNMVQLARYELRPLPAGGVILVMPRPFPLSN
jgi:hypothetical protein